MIKIHAKKSWFASFEQSSARSGLTNIIEFQDSDKILVIVKGKGYIINSLKPEFCYELPITPIIDAAKCNDSNIIILISNMEVFGVSENGIEWRTNRLTQEGVKIEKIEKNYAIVRIWNDQNEKYELLSIDCDKGKVVSRKFAG